MDFNKYDDVIDMIGYDGFIDKSGNFYRVGLKRKKGLKNTHNDWAEKFMKEKLNTTYFNFNPTVSALLTLSKLSGPTDILVDCFGYVYYSHDPIYYNPIIKLPDPKICDQKATEEQLVSLFMLMTLHKENTDIPIFYDDETFDYSDIDNMKSKRL